MTSWGLIILVWNLALVYSFDKLLALQMENVRFATSNPVDCVPAAGQLLAVHDGGEQAHILEIVLVHFGKGYRLGGAGRQARNSPPIHVGG